jgi:S1-C subfamily serine protease
MVKPPGIVPIIGVTLALVCPLRAAPDGILEQMQNEVAAIIRQARKAVVSIEGAREEMPVSSAGAPRESPESRMIAAIRDRMEQLQKQLSQSETARKTEIEREIGTLQQRVNELDKLGRERAQQIAVTLANRPKSGTGFSIGDGLILTTGDVLEGMKEPVVTTDDGTRVRATIVGMDYLTNVGLLKLAAMPGLPALPLADSSKVETGHFAISIGNQSGHVNSAALTMVAGIRAEGAYFNSHYYPRLIQVAGTVGAGTSGAPLLNARGEVIGIIAAVPAGDWSEIPLPSPGAASPGEQSLDRPSGELQVASRKSLEGSATQTVVKFLRPPVTSAGFAIAINDVKPILEELQKSGGKIARGWFGVALDDDVRYEEEGGIQKVLQSVKIIAVFPDSPVYHAGVQPGDVLLSINDKPLRSTLDFVAAAAQARVGQRVVLQIKHPSGTQSVEITIDSRPRVMPQPLIVPYKRTTGR